MASGVDALLTEHVAGPSQAQGQRKPCPGPGVPQPAGGWERDYGASAPGWLRDVFWLLARAQELEHVQVGIYGDYFHLNQTTSNFADIGARVGTGISPHVQTEGEMAYDCNQAITQSVTNGSGETLRREIELAAWRVWAQTGTGALLGATVSRGQSGI